MMARSGLKNPKRIIRRFDSTVATSGVVYSAYQRGAGESLASPIYVYEITSRVRG